MSERAAGNVVSVERLGEVAVIRIDNPPINAGSTAVRKGVLAAVRALDADSTLTGAVLMGAGRMFMGGSDMREFGAPVAEPHITEVIQAMRDSPKPIVAAIAGAALGGGYELSLGCDSRITTPEAVVGLPECLLGMMPGAGGTQALPRLVGMEKAVELICAGTRVKASEAARIGMIDAVAEGDLLQAALDNLRCMNRKKRVVTHLPLPPVDEDKLALAKAAALKAGNNRPNFRLAIEAIENARRMPVKEALELERKVFLELRAGREAAALRHLFFAEREAARRDVPPAADIGPRIVAAGQSQCQLMMEKGLSGREINTALEKFGFPAGAFAIPGQRETAAHDFAPAGEIIDRILAAMANEAAILISEKAVAAPADIDLLLTRGYGFPRHEGGVVFWAQNQPKEDLQAAMRRLSEESGSAFRLGPVEVLRPAEDVAR